MDRDLAHVDLENQLAAANVRQGHHHLAVEAPGAQQRRIQHVGPVGGGNDDDALAAGKPVHLHQELVQRLLSLVVTAAHAGAAVATDGVDLVDEDDARRLLLGLLEHVAHSRCAHAHEHLDEIRSGDGKEGSFGLAGDRARQQRLAGAGRAHHEHALGDLAAQPLKPGRVLQELDDLGNLLLGFLDACDVLESHGGLVRVEQAGAAAAEGHGTAPAAHAALHLAHEIQPDADQQQERQQVEQEGDPGAFRLRFGRMHLRAACGEFAHQFGIVRGGRAVGHEFLSADLFAPNRAVFQDLDFLDPAVAHQFEELREIDLLGLSATVVQGLQQHHQGQRYDQPQEDILGEPVHYPAPSGRTTIHEGPRCGKRTGAGHRSVIAGIRIKCHSGCGTILR